jgi:hypothetical protein
MSPQNREPLIVGCHHKTGTLLLFNIGEAMMSRLWAADQFVSGTSNVRKQPLSRVLSTLPKTFRCYFNQWFEHEIDVDPASIRFLQLVRHPVTWVRSAYLYHRNGGPSEGVRWLDWRIFRLAQKQLSYCELLNEVDEDVGVSIEAVRSFPEIAGTARASRSARHLLAKRIVTLDQFESNFEVEMRSICGFAGLDSAATDEVMNSTRKYDIANRAARHKRPNVTRGSERAAQLESCLNEDAGFRHLYKQLAQDMGLDFDSHPSDRALLPLNQDLIRRILDAKEHLLRDAASEEAIEFLRSAPPEGLWLAYALQSFGEGGHLMMYEFIREMLLGIA